MEGGLLEDEPATSHPEEDIEEAQDERNVEGGKTCGCFRDTCFGIFADIDKVLKVWETGVVLHVAFALCPSTGAGKPEEGQKSRQPKVNDRHSLVLNVHLIGEQVDSQNAHAVEK